MPFRRLTIIRIILTSYLFALITPVQLQLVRENLPFALAILIFIVAPGIEAGMTRLAKFIPSQWTHCRTEQKSLDVAIRDVGKLLDVGPLSGVTYDVPPGVPHGTNHLHVTFMLFRVGDEQ